MRTFAILFPSKITTANKSEVIKTLHQIASWSEGRLCILLYAHDTGLSVKSVINELWPININFYDQNMDKVLHMALAHMIIQTNANNVYQIGDPTGAEELFAQMGIEITKLPLE